MNKNAEHNVLNDDLTNSTSEFIRQLFVGLLSRESEPTDLSCYIELIRGGATLADVARLIASSPEIKVKHPQPSLPSIDKDIGEFVINGHKMFVPLNDIVYYESRITGTYEPHVSQAITDHLNPHGTFPDVGSNIGAHSIEASAKVGPRGTVYSVDASIENCAVHNKSIRCFGHGNITVMPHAVGVSPAIENIKIDDNSSNKSIRKTATVNSLKIVVIPIDHLLIYVGKFDLIKIGVEGRKAGVLSTCSGILLNSKYPVVPGCLGRDRTQYTAAEGHYTDFLIQMGYTPFVIDRDHTFTKLDGSAASFEGAINAKRATGGDVIDLLFKFI